MSDSDSESAHSSEVEENAEKAIAKDIVVTKYKMAADITNNVLKALIGKCVEGASNKDICQTGDNMLREQTGSIFKKEKDMKKGIAFPTCVSINNCCGNYSALKSDNEIFLKKGDMVKVTLGAHVDGFATLAGHTVVVGASKEKKVTGRSADVLMAAHNALEACLRLIKPDVELTQVCDTVKTTADQYDCHPLEGVTSDQTVQHDLVATKALILAPNELQRLEMDKQKYKFQLHEVYIIDVMISTGDGRPRDGDVRSRVFKRDRDADIFQLRVKASRLLHSQAEKTAGYMVFSLSQMDDENRARMGVKECVDHGLFKEYPVKFERDGALVAQFKTTVLLMPNGLLKITGLPFEKELVNSSKSITDEELKKLLAQPISASKNSKKAAKKKRNKAKQSLQSTLADITSNTAGPTPSAADGKA